MAKKQISIYLDEEAVAKVRGFLEKSGQSFSHWMNAIITEFAHEIDGQPSPLNKPIDEMTVREFAEVASYWWKRARGSDESEDRREGPS